MRGLPPIPFCQISLTFFAKIFNICLQIFHRSSFCTGQISLTILFKWDYTFIFSYSLLVPSICFKAPHSCNPVDPTPNHFIRAGQLPSLFIPFFLQSSLIIIFMKGRQFLQESCLYHPIGSSLQSCIQNWLKKEWNIIKSWLQGTLAGSQIQVQTKQ